MIADTGTLNASATLSTGRHRIVRIALLGCGNVGAAVARLLLHSRERLRDAHGVDLQLTGILVRDAGRRRDGIDARFLTADVENVLRARPDVVIEALGGREPAATFVRTALERGISVVTANKTLIAHDGPALERIARAAASRQTGSSPSAAPRLVYEASVGAAIPVLSALRQRAGDPIIALRAVLNGTCNFILSRMSETGSPLSSVLPEAIARGLAEPDPSADLSGRDSAEKLCILARAAGFAHVTPDSIPVVGIESVTPRDLQAAREHGCVIRLVAELEAIDGFLRLRAGPSLVPFTHPLARAKSAENVIVLDQQFGGRLVLHGEGAGPEPTAAAILGDVLNVLGAQATHACWQRQAADIAQQPSRRLVRVPRSQTDAVHCLLQRASHVQVRCDVVEAILDAHEDAIDLPNTLVAPFIDTRTSCAV